MAEVTAGLVKELRELTGLGMMECKKALTEAGGDLKKAEELLRIKSGAKAGKAAARVAAEGVIASFLAADGRAGALVEVNCETDFVARSEAFRTFAHEVALQIAAGAPRYCAGARADRPPGALAAAGATGVAGTAGDPRAAGADRGGHRHGPCRCTCPARFIAVRHRGQGRGPGRRHRADRSVVD